MTFYGKILFDCNIYSYYANKCYSNTLFFRDIRISFNLNKILFVIYEYEFSNIILFKIFPLFISLFFIRKIVKFGTLSLLGPNKQNQTGFHEGYFTLESNRDRGFLKERQGYKI